LGKTNYTGTNVAGKIGQKTGKEENTHGATLAGILTRQTKNEGTTLEGAQKGERKVQIMTKGER